MVDVLADLLEGTKYGDEIIAIFKKLVARNQELELLLAKLRERRNRGEQVSAAQLALLFETLGKQATHEEQAEANCALKETAAANGGRAADNEKPPRQPPLRRKPPAGLRRVPNDIAVPPAERPCPSCGGARRCIFHETTEVIDLVPAEVIVRLDRREVLGCDRCDGEVARAPLGDKVVEGGAYGSRLVADLVVGKYRDGLPLHRQGQILERLGLSMPSSSMADQILWATDLLRPLWQHLKTAVLGAHVMHLDATGLPVRDGNHPGGIAIGTLWGYVGVDGPRTSALYLYNSTGKKVGQRDGEIGPEEFLDLRQGFVVSDADTRFDKSYARADIVAILCNMHARRYWKKALDAGDARAAVPIAAYRALYDIEDTVRDKSVEERLAERRKRARPIYEQLIEWCKTYRPSEPPSSLLGKAIAYQINHCTELMRFLDDGTLPIDNGIVERLHRRPAITRRNFLFAGSHAGAERAAIAYSVLACCELAGANPVEYLADVLPKLARGVVIARDIPRMIPAVWKSASHA